LPSSGYWKRAYLDGLESMLRGVPPPTDDLSPVDDSEPRNPWWLPGSSPPKPGWGSAPHQPDDPMPSDVDDRLAFWLVSHNAPTIAQLLDGLILHAKILSRGRTHQKKRRVTGESGSIGRVTRYLTRGLLTRFPRATSAQLARIAAPVAELLLDKDDLLDRVTMQIKRLRREAKPQRHREQ